MIKKTLVLFTILLFLSSVSSAQLLIGARAAGMGGASVAACRDLTAAYYNPAALMKSPGSGGIVSAGLSYSNPDKILNAALGVTDPIKFMADNFASKLDFTGSLSGIAGFSMNKIGVTVLPLASISLNKPALSLSGIMGGTLYSPVALTLGHTVGVPLIGDLSIGTNLKYIYAANGNVSATAPIPPLTSGSATQTYAIGSGFGLDVGALATFGIPFLTEFSVGAAARNLFESVSYSGKSQTYTTTDSDYTLVSETDTSYTTNPESSYALGASGTVPVIGLLVAGDLEMISGSNSRTNTHLGLEYPLIADLLNLRAGLAMGKDISLTTLGAKIGIPFFALNLAYVMDGKTSSNSYFVFDFVGGI